MANVRDDITLGQLALRTAGLVVILLTTLVCAVIAGGYVLAGQGSGKQFAAVAGLSAAAVALFAMLVDAFDYWLRPRRMTASRLRMIRSLIFVTMLVAVVLSILAGTPAFFILMTPALMIYLFGVMRRRPEPIRRPPGRPGRQPGGGTGQRLARSRASAAGGSRQRRGGKKRA
ncbi:MAG TPA: hypothetical protein PLB30_04560 [Thermoleophilia bacterium]|nr:hypothetical protein [Thermoleophilia bacterium]HQG03982.1 hypothetical protein [Thermoleophilia bacterium]HQG54224.1 hypothetical protein [Thermoleophilia bacterium]HQJ97808.1 hypothetical protein [Thermoleophilia bacterium]